jgi:hypothetical protein
MTELQPFGRFSPQEFAQFGMSDVAYVKPITVNDQLAFAIHAADGTQMAVLRDRDVAFAAVRQHDLEPVSLH